MRSFCVLLLWVALLEMGFSCYPKKNSPSPEPNFVINEVGTNRGKEIVFRNQSKYAKSFHWDFGDGSTSAEKSPRHTYTQSGIYTVTLTVKGEGGTVLFVDTIQI